MLLRVAVAAVMRRSPCRHSRKPFRPAIRPTTRRRSPPPRRKARSSIYSALDTKAAQPLIKDFKALYPGIKVEYNDMNSTEMYNRFIAEAASGQGSADVMWSSAMDLQVKLVDDGQALTYASPEASKLPAGRCTRTRPTARRTSRPCSSTTSACVTGDEVPQDHAGIREAARHARPTSSRARSRPTTSRRSASASCSSPRTRKYFPRHEGPREGASARRATRV